MPLTTGTGQSTSQSTGQSTSTPVVMNTPQNQFQLQLAAAIAKHGQSQYGWAQNQYNYLRGLADEAVPQYLSGAAESKQLADQQLKQYSQMYLPAQQRFNELANSYSSPARQNYAMGQAEADATQASNAAWQNTKNDLQSHGVDPSSGEYAGLKAAANTAAGASAAGAANQARQGVENTGIGLQEQNINFGQTMPASALNAINADYAGQAGAVNTGQSTTNTATNAFNGANSYFDTAMKVQAPQVAQQQQSTNQSTSQQSNWTGTPQYNVHTGVFYEKGGLVEPADSYRRGGKVRGGGGHGGGHGKHGGGGGGGSSAPDSAPPPKPPAAMIALGDGTYANVGRNGSTGWEFSDAGSHAPHHSSSGGGGSGVGRTGRTHGGGGQTADNPDSVSGGGPPPSGSLNSPMPDSAPSPSPDSQSTPPPAPTSPSDGAFAGPPMDQAMARGGGIPEWQPHGHQGRPHPAHPYHVNGLPDAATGGHVPYELSPSHGHTTDDVVANLNAGEFVIPRRTVHHYGHKFLYDLIAKGDKEMGMHPQVVGGKPLKPGSGAEKARSAATGQNFSAGGGL